MAPATEQAYAAPQRRRAEPSASPCSSSGPTSCPARATAASTSAARRCSALVGAPSASRRSARSATSARPLPGDGVETREQAHLTPRTIVSAMVSSDPTPRMKSWGGRTTLADDRREAFAHRRAAAHRPLEPRDRSRGRQHVAGEHQVADGTVAGDPDVCLEHTEHRGHRAAPVEVRPARALVHEPIIRRCGTSGRRRFDELHAETRLVATADARRPARRTSDDRGVHAPARWRRPGRPSARRPHPSGSTSSSRRGSAAWSRSMPRQASMSVAPRSSISRPRSPIVRRATVMVSRPG